jgi:LDH2 family malate/lactate/ureidoglycolate dehydrogenase
VKRVRPAVGFEEVLLPGDKEERYKAARLKEGIPLPDSVWNDMSKLAADYGLAVPQDGVYV